MTVGLLDDIISVSYLKYSKIVIEIVDAFVIFMHVYGRDPVTGTNAVGYPEMLSEHNIHTSWGAENNQGPRA